VIFYSKKVMILVLKVVKDLGKDAHEDLHRLVSGYIAADQLKKELEGIDHHPVSEHRRRIRKAKRALRWLKRASLRFAQEAKVVVTDLERVGKIGLSQRMEEIDRNLARRLDMQWKKFAQLVSRYGDSQIDRDFALLEKSERDLEAILQLKSTQTTRAQQNVHQLIMTLEKDAQTLITWIQGTDEILKEIIKFEEFLERESLLAA